MDFVCPLCNGFALIELNCEKCNKKMVDKGREADYYDSYSPYLPMSLTSQIDGYPEDKCVHIFYCEHCGKSSRFAVERKRI
ncbi:MAG TPA: hypothetical protein PLL17_01790 [Defluviitaleaceae bacterium]|nr:hypothetical protein [Candidatus Epulonipiscium sp.]HOQ16849.1 hypothetical protein [Defluviitaleaceae bacterium]HPT75608.1 hypothetical protein [Defluviitaleaceae bacterium]HQD49850.1 hypothetical protein [Defluviitaleaceae bacterium]